MSDPIEHFRLAIAAAGLEAPDSINADGAIHRFSTNGKPRDDSGWYMLHTDGLAAGAFGCWREGLQSTWCAKSKQWPSGGVISSEAGSVFGGHGMGSDSVMRNLAALNQLWDGATLRWQPPGMLGRVANW